MASFNRSVLVGNLTRDPEYKEFGDSGVCKFTLAISSKFKDKEDVLFMDVQCWGIQGKNAHQYLKKGSSALVEGTLKQETWEDAATHTKRSKVLLNASQIVFLSTKDLVKDRDIQVEMPMAKRKAAPEHTNLEGQGLLTDDDSLPF